MSDQVPLSSLQFLPLQSHEFHSLPAGFEYQHAISEASNTTAFDTRVDARDLRRCVVCGKKAAGGLRPGVQRAHIIGKTEDILWDFLKSIGFVPSFAKSVVHEPRNGINLCDAHHSDFDDYRFFIRWVPSVRVFVFVNFSQNEYLEQFHGKTVALDPNHNHSPFPAPFLIQEMRSRGFHPWCTDRPIPRPLSPTYALVDNGGGGGVAGLGGGSDTRVGFGGSGGMAGPGGSGGAASSSSGPTSTGINQQYLILSNPFQDPELLESMCRQWQQLPNWKSATVEGMTWQGTAEENARKYVDLVGSELLNPEITQFILSLVSVEELEIPAGTLHYLDMFQKNARVVALPCLKNIKIRRGSTSPIESSLQSRVTLGIPVDTLTLMVRSGAISDMAPLKKFTGLTVQFLNGEGGRLGIRLRRRGRPSLPFYDWRSTVKL